MKEEIIKTIETKKGAKVSLIKPQGGLPFFRYHAGSGELLDSFRYIIKQCGNTDTATVNVQVESSILPGSDLFKFNEMLDYFLETCVTNFMDGSKGTLALTNLLGIDEGEPLDNDWMNDVVFKRFENIFNVKESLFVFEKHSGDYNYIGKGVVSDDPKIVDWEYIPNDSNIINIRFPSTIEKHKEGDNDARLTIGDYQYVEVKIDHDQPESGIKTLYLPTSFKADFFLGKEHYYGAYLNGKDTKIPTKYHRYGIPISGDLRLYVNPYDLHLQVTSKMTKVKGFETNIKFMITHDKCQLGVDIVINLPHDDFDKIEITDVKVPKADLIVNDLTFTKLGTLFEAAKDEEFTQKELDEVVDIDVLMNGEKIGDIWFMLENEDIEVEFEDKDKNKIRLNISDRFIKFFEGYYSGTKEDGMPRNDAFYYKGSQNYREREAAAGSLKAAQIKAIEKIIEGSKKRFFRKPLDNAKRAEAFKEYFTDQGAKDATDEKRKP